MILVLAGNYRQFTAWCHEQRMNPREALYLDCLERVMGWRECQVVKVGTWNQNPIYDERFMDYLRMVESRRG